MVTEGYRPFGVPPRDKREYSPTFCIIVVFKYCNFGAWVTSKSS